MWGAQVEAGKYGRGSATGGNTTASWGPPAGGQPLVASGLSRLVSAAALLATVVSAAVAGAFMYNVMQLLRLRAASANGSAWWWDGRALKAAKRGFLLGRHDDRLLHNDGAGHLMTVAATRSGKGVGSIIPNLLHFPGSVVVTDPKGENYYVTVRYRREDLGHEVVAMDPFGITLATSSGFNPLDLIDLTGDDYVETAMMLAEMIVVRKAGANTEPHWVMEGKALQYAFILHAASLEDTKKRNLIAARRMLTLEREEMAKLLDAMSASPIAQVREGVARLEQKAERDGGRQAEPVPGTPHGAPDGVCALAAAHDNLRVLCLHTRGHQPPASGPATPARHSTRGGRPAGCWPRARRLMRAAWRPPSASGSVLAAGSAGMELTFDKSDLRAFVSAYAGQGAEAYPPSMLLYGYAKGN